LAPKSAKSHKIPTEYEVMTGQGHPRSSLLVPIEIAWATSY